MPNSFSQQAPAIGLYNSLSINHLRALGGVLDDDLALMAGLITLHPLKQQQSRNFNQFMASAGHIPIKGRQYARMQVRTIAEIQERKLSDTPGRIGKRQSPQIDLGF